MPCKFASLVEGLQICQLPEVQAVEVSEADKEKKLMATLYKFISSRQRLCACVRAVSRNNGVPPAPPSLSVVSSSPSSITLGWTKSSVDGGAPLVAYRIHYHREFGDWERLEVPPERLNHTLQGLKCGTKYQFYIQVGLLTRLARFLGCTMI